MVFLRAILCFSLCNQGVHAHFLWLKQRGLNTGVVTFDEKAGVPGPAFFLPMVKDKIRVSLVNASGKVDLQLSAHNTSAGGGELTTSINAAPPFSFNLACIFGIFDEDPKKPVSLLKYYSNADMVTKPNDWFQVQDWNKQEGLEVTIRDPWMKRSAAEYGVHSVSGDPGDECKPHAGPEQDGQACVVAVIRFNGQLLTGNISLTTYIANGTKLRTTVSTSGVTILRIPLNTSLPFTEVFAAANYREASPGTYGGQNYSLVDHWATTYARLSRANDVIV
jgi:hypothetical protein